MLRKVLLVTVSLFLVTWGALAFSNLFTEGQSIARARGKDSAFLREGDIIQDSIFTIGFGSCNKHNRNQSFWEYVGSAAKQLSPATPVGSGFIWLGDVVYADTTYGPGIWVRSSIATMKEKYESLRNNSYYDAFVKAARYVVGVWDDHDMGCNDGGVECAVKDDVQQMFLDFLDVPPRNPRRERKGLYSLSKMEFEDPRSSPLASHYQYALCVVLLDVRYFRTPIMDNRTGNVLGETQWAWLDETLASISDDSVKDAGDKKPCLATLIGSGVQVLADEKPAEQWGNFKFERDRLFNAVRRNRVERAMFISGDVHLGEVQREDSGTARCEEGSAVAAMGYPIVDVTASGFTHSTGDIMPLFFFDKYLPSPRRLGRHLARNFATFSLHHDDQAGTGDQAGGTGLSATAQFVIYDVLSRRPVLVHKQSLTDLESSRYRDKCLTDGTSRILPLNDADPPPLKVLLLSIKEVVPFLKMHQVIYIILFSAMGAGILVGVSVVMLLWSVCFLKPTKKEKQQ